MAIYLGHESALRYWLTKNHDEAIPGIAASRSLANAEARMAEIKAAPLPMDFTEKRPLHVLMPARSGCRTLKRVKVHVWKGALPPASFCELAGQRYVSSPEFTFLQLASRRSITETVEIGCNLCSTFAVDDSGRGYAGKRNVLTFPEQLMGFARSAKGAYGSACAVRALRYVTPGAASPMEVLLVMAFTLPPELGGWRMPEVVANQPIGVDDRLVGLAGSRHFVSDIYLPSVRGDVEYDSYEYHTGKHRLDHTQARRNVLEVMGIKTVSATWGQISDFDKFEAFIWMVKERFGLEQCAFTKQERSAQISLYEHFVDTGARLF